MADAYQIKDQNAVYFLTFQVVGWVDVFSRKSYRDIVLDSLKYCRENKSLCVYGYVIMTNHMHVIWQSESGNLSDAVRDFKRHVSKKILAEISAGGKESRKEWLELVFRYHAKFNKRVGEKQLWTHENHAVELTTNAMSDQRLDYIHQNPVAAGWVEKQEDYLYSSAANYILGKGLIEIDKMG